MKCKYCKYYFLLAFMLNVTGIRSQNGLGQPVLYQSFGIGSADLASTGPALPSGATSFIYSAERCPLPNSYSIVTYINWCFNNTWIPLSSDYSSDVDTSMSLGYMMLVHPAAHATSQLVYVDTVKKALCPGAQYEFSFAVINADRPIPCPGPVPAFPYFALNIENVSGVVLFTDTIKGVDYASPEPGYKFRVYGLRFVMPGGIDKLIARIMLLPSNADCASDFAIDEVRISAAGPAAKIAFVNEPENLIVKSVCYQQNKTILLNGSMDSFYIKPALQWQQSTDDGVSWADIPGATTNNYSRVFSNPDTFLFRLSGGEAANIFNPNCRVVSNIMKVEVDGIPSNFSISNNSPICAGQDLIFTANGGASYIWTGPNGFYDSSPFPHIYLSSLEDSGTYHVNVITRGGCRTSDSTYVIMKGIDVKPGPDTAICKGNTIQLNAGTIAASYLWSPKDGLSGVSTPKPLATPIVSTTYSLLVTDGSGCSNTGKVTVKVLNSIAITADFFAPEYICRSSDTASFVDKSTGNIVSWLWDFGNGQKSTLSNPPVQQYLIAGNINSFQVGLVISDSIGCKATAVHPLKVADNCFIAVPSAFSPNGDGLNDYLYPLNAYKAKELVFRVFNRDGKLMFETKDWTRKWDGSFNGEPQPPGAYVWSLRYFDKNKKISLKGTTLLIR